MPAPGRGAAKAFIFDLDGTLTLPQLDFAAIRAEMGITDGPILEELEALAPAQAEAARKAKAFEALQVKSAVAIQKVFRGFLTRSIVFPLLLEQRRLNAEADRIRLNQRMDAALTMQAWARGWKHRRNLRRQFAAIKIQKIWRGFLCRNPFRFEPGSFLFFSASFGSSFLFFRFSFRFCLFF